MLTYTYYFNCLDGDKERLDNISLATNTLETTSSSLGLTVVAKAEHHFKPQGISVALVLAESHIALHTWPEEGSAYILLSSCRKLEVAKIENARLSIQKAFSFRTLTCKELS